MSAVVINIRTHRRRRLASTHTHDTEFVALARRIETVAPHAANEVFMELMRRFLEETLRRRRDDGDAA